MRRPGARSTDCRAPASRSQPKRSGGWRRGSRGHGGSPDVGRGLRRDSATTDTATGPCRSQRRHRCSPRSTRSLPTSSACPPHVDESPRRRASRSTSSSSAASEPFLFHTGMRQLFPLVSEAVAGVIPVERPAMDLVRSRRGRRVRGDEPVPRRRAERRGRARRARLHGLAQRPGRPPAAHHGRRRGARHRRTPHAVPARRRTSPTTGRAGCGSTRRPARCSPATSSRTSGDGPAVTSDDIVEPALVGEEIFHSTSLGPNVGPDVASPGRPEADDAGHDARLVVSRRRCAAARGAGSRLRHHRRRRGRVTAR